MIGATIMQLQPKMPQKSRNNVFRRKQTTNKMPPKIFRVFEVAKKGVRGFSKAKEQKQRLMKDFQKLKTNNKVCLVYLKSKLQQDRYS